MSELLHDILGSKGKFRKLTIIGLSFIIILTFISEFKSCSKYKTLYLNQESKTEVIVKEIRDTIWKIDTIKYIQPKLIYQEIIHYKEINIDSVLIQLPITQSIYTDSTYTAYITGYDCMLDSIFTYNTLMEITHTIETTINNTIVIQPKKWGFCIYGGVGVQYGVITRKIDFGPQVGIGFYYRINNGKKSKF
jgi:hypothetical protein